MYDRTIDELVIDFDLLGTHSMMGLYVCVKYIAVNRVTRVIIN